MRVAGGARFQSVATLFLFAILAACATGGLRAPGAGETPPWQIPSEAFGSQRLYRVNYSGPEGEGSFRVTLRLAAADRYQIQAVDPVGRSLWSLDVTSERGVWLDHRNKATCEFGGSFDVSGVPLGPFPLLSLPSLLMGRVPETPAAGQEPDWRGRQLEFQDETGRKWTGEMGAAGEMEGWTLWNGAQPAVWFMRRDSWSYLSDRSRGVQVRWREVLREELKRELEPLLPPAGYRQAPCAELYPRVPRD
ncbi:MAG TPA: hypothetical protein VE078_20190 [Thermoanaerobaculia bacterium]|nr:hypothetical protein [Thermoanaerobaculia bacterium]